MKGRRDFTERRQHERAFAQNLIVAILNTEEPVTIGLINDISLGGVKYTYELTMAPGNTPIHSIDLIAESKHLIDIPCEYAWNVDLEGKSYSNSRYLRQCGIQFGRLNPDQIFILRSLINRCTSHGLEGITPNIYIACSR
ncbi:MAG: hypothetical protein AMJ60_00365 [Desulfobacterales bacterium SG8_35]|nr:MAG: hypothetical protein AMJ60_00365 [Desulfobacterales bacterium SG8_35]